MAGPPSAPRAYPFPSSTTWARPVTSPPLGAPCQTTESASRSSTAAPGTSSTSRAAKAWRKRSTLGCSAIGGPGAGDGAELLQETEQVVFGPLLHDSPVGDA